MGTVTGADAFLVVFSGAAVVLALVLSIGAFLSVRPRPTNAARDAQTALNELRKAERHAASVAFGTKSTSAAPVKEPSTLPKCLCEHWFVVHDAETFQCVHQGCKCQQYMGPDPVLSGLWMATRPMKGPLPPNDMSFMHPSEVAEVVGMLQKNTEDPVAAHALEDSLYLRVLRDIAAGHPAPKTVAATAIQAADIPFARWDRH